MDRNALRTRLRAVNIEHTRLLKDETAPERSLQMAALRAERANLISLLAGDPTLRLVSRQLAAFPPVPRQSN